MASSAAQRSPLWIAAVTGLVAIIFGLLLLVWPGLTLFVFTWLFGGYAFVTGVIALVGAFRARQADAVWWPQLALGIIGVVAGLFAVFYGGMTTVLLVTIIAFWAIAVGVVEVAAAFLLGQQSGAVLGAVSILFGFLLLASSERGALAIVIVVGAYALVRGFLQLAATAQAAGQTVSGG